MNRETLRGVIGITAVVSAPALTSIVLLHQLPNGAHEAAVILATLAWQHAGAVIRSQFPAPEGGMPTNGKDGNV